MFGQDGLIWDVQFVNWNLRFSDLGVTEELINNFFVGNSFSIQAELKSIY